MSVWEFCIRRPVFTTVLILSLVVVGIMGYTRMGVDLMPDFDIPAVSIVTTYLGADPEVMDQDVTDVIEEQVGSLEGIESIRSTSYESYSTIVVEFNLARDIDVAAQEVRDKVSAAEQDLPTGIEPPLVQKVDPDAQPILYLTLCGDAGYAELSELADKTIKPRLQNTPGVGNVVMMGFRERNVRIWLDPAGMEKYDVGPAQVLSALSNWHVELPGGRVENASSEATIKMQGEFPSIDELGDLLVDWRNGAPVRLRDLARLEDGQEDTRMMARYNGKEAIMLGVCKQSGSNTVSIAATVRNKVDELRANLPKSVDIRVMFDQSEFIENAVNGVGTDLILGCFLTAIVIYVFLSHYKMTVISLISIPASLLSAFGFMYFLGFTTNQITMLAMSLSVGLVVDDSIVVLENIYRHFDEDDGTTDPRDVSMAGTNEVAFAVLASTVVVAAIFLPVSFMGGIIGRIFYQFGVSIGLAIMLSYVVSVTLTPMLCGRWLTKETNVGFMARAVGAVLDWMNRIYKTLLSWSLHSRFTRVCVIVGSLAFFALGLLLVQHVGTEFSPKQDRSAFLIYMETPIGSSIELTNQRSAIAEKIVQKHPEVLNYACMVGNNNGQVYKSTIIVDMVPRDQRTKSQTQLMNELRVELATIPGIVCYPSEIPQMGGVGGGTRSTDLSFVLQGPDLMTLEKIANTIVTEASKDPDFRDVDNDLELTQPQVSVYPKREAAADVRLDTRQIAVALQAMMGGVDAAKFKMGGQRYDIRVKADDSFRVSSDSIKKIILRTNNGERVDFGTVADVVEGIGPNSIKRYDRMRSVSIIANIAPGVASGNASEKFEGIANKVLEKYPGYNLKASGMTKVERESMGYLMFAFYSSIVIIYLVLCAQFESFVHPLTIMMTLPLAVVGVFAALLLTGENLSIFAVIGMIMLVGIVTKNGILLVEFANQLREQGRSAVESMLEAGPIRLRPILMTAVSTIGGMLPVALGMSEGGEARRGMAVAVIGGLTTSTFLTLVVIPVAYITFEGIANGFSKVQKRLFGRADKTKTGEEKQ